MMEMPRDAIVAEFDAMERIADRTLDWSHIGEQIAFIEDAHDLILEAWAQELTFARDYASEYQKHELRALWLLVDDERQARRNGKVAHYMTPQAKAQASIRERCDAVRERISLGQFIDLETDCDVRRNRCRCPIHDGDSEFSFSIQNGYGRCFACGWHGDVIDLAQAVWNLDRPIDAVKKLEAWG